MSNSTTDTTIEQLEAEVREAFERASAVRGDAAFELVTEPAARFAAEQVIRGGSLARNGATVMALRHATAQLVGTELADI